MGELTGGGAPSGQGHGHSHDDSDDDDDEEGESWFAGGERRCETRLSRSANGGSIYLYEPAVSMCKIPIDGEEEQAQEYREVIWLEIYCVELQSMLPCILPFSMLTHVRS